MAEIFRAVSFSFEIKEEIFWIILEGNVKKMFNEQRLLGLIKYCIWEKSNC